MVSETSQGALVLWQAFLAERQELFGDFRDERWKTPAASGLLTQSQPDASVLKLRIFRPCGPTNPLPVA